MAHFYSEGMSYSRVAAMRQSEVWITARAVDKSLSEGSQGVVCREEGSLINTLSLFIIAKKWKQSKCPSTGVWDFSRPLPSLAIMKKVAINKKKKDMVFIDEHLTLKSADFPKASRLSLSCLAPLCVLLGCWVSAPGFVLSLWLPPTAAHATQCCSDSYPWSPNLDCFL